MLNKNVFPGISFMEIALFIKGINTENLEYFNCTLKHHFWFFFYWVNRPVLRLVLYFLLWKGDLNSLSLKDGYLSKVFNNWILYLNSKCNFMTGSCCVVCFESEIDGSVRKGIGYLRQ